MRKRSRSNIALLLTATFLFLGCGNWPGRPTTNSIPIDPDNITDFNVLFGSNCAGCHGAQGKGGAALAIADPVYLAIVDDSTLRKVVADGINGTSMAAFAKSTGGMLTDSQVDIIVHGLREHYSKPGILTGVTPPPYSSTEPGNPTRGAAVYDSFCGSC